MIKTPTQLLKKTKYTAEVTQINVYFRFTSHTLASVFTKDW